MWHWETAVAFFAFVVTRLRREDSTNSLPLCIPKIYVYFSSHDGGGAQHLFRKRKVCVCVLWVCISIGVRVEVQDVYMRWRPTMLQDLTARVIFSRTPQANSFQTGSCCPEPAATLLRSLCTRAAQTSR